MKLLLLPLCAPTKALVLYLHQPILQQLCALNHLRWMCLTNVKHTNMPLLLRLFAVLHAFLTQMLPPPTCQLTGFLTWTSSVTKNPTQPALLPIPETSAGSLFADKRTIAIASLQNC
jgi:hypothetical protein